ncbi:major facilitator superfamily-domain-containing protein [Paecilomyces variotii]|uniref:Major facilitator superfamily-domain-containing protein n=1 Tax=Byssochlamys spectabilis TaxID=264951 RepID=A0A443HKE3_BYSSP|nr:major facilitator superfamily-domain-containing protein [Paecilomyces variotii]RWQ92235.1 major facilitator superfamily-domain-containing protein [Paecilomyces variotii]
MAAIEVMDSDGIQEWEKEEKKKQEDVDPEALTKTLTEQSHVVRPKSLPKEILFVSVVCAAQFMTQAGLAQSIAPLHVIGASFGTTSENDLSWCAAAYSLTIGTFILVAGRLGDVYGHKLMFTIGFVWFGLWSLIAGFSVWSNQIFFDVCRALQGIGPALLLPNAVAIFGRAYEPGPRKDMVFSLFGATAPGGFVVGSTFSTIFAQLVWWPWAYWVMGIVCFCFAVLGVLVIPRTPSPKFNDGLSTFVRLDVLGASAGISALVLINFAWNQGPVVGWQVPYNYILLIVGFLFLAVFFLIERKATCPLLPWSVFTGDVGWVLGCIAAGWSSFGTAIFYFYQFMEVIKGDTGLLVSAKWCPAAISGAVAAVTTGFLLSRVPPSVIMFCAMCAFTTGLALLATLPPDQIYWAQAFVMSIVICWGMDMSFPSGTVILSNSMHHQHQGLAGSLVNTVVNYSISIGLGFAGTVESQVNDGGKDRLKGIRGASYMGLGFAGLGLILSVCFMIETWWRSRHRKL